MSPAAVACTSACNAFADDDCPAVVVGDVALAAPVAVAARELVLGGVDDFELLPQPAANNARASSAARRTRRRERFMPGSSCAPPEDRLSASADCTAARSTLRCHPAQGSSGTH